MKKLKLSKLASLALSLVLMLSFATPAFANDGTSRTQTSSAPAGSESMPQSGTPAQSESLPENTESITSVPESTESTPASTNEIVPASSELLVEPPSELQNENSPPNNAQKQTSELQEENNIEEQDANTTPKKVSVTKTTGTTIADPTYTAGDTIEIVGDVLEAADWAVLKVLVESFHLVLETADAEIPSAAMTGNLVILSFTASNITKIALAAASTSQGAFRGCTGLAKIDMPKATTIGNYAFADCTSLASISLPAATSIGNSVFYDCENLASISLPAATSIGEDAFVSCTRLSSISLPAATGIGSNAFYGCTGLASISLPAATGIGSNAFNKCTSLASISLPAAQTIGDYAFSGCISLASISLPAAQTIVDYTFWNCTSLASISLPAAQTIGDYAFYGCTGLATISLPAAETIGNCAFSGCISLASISLPAAHTIGQSAFEGCTSLASISLPAAHTIGQSAFEGCTSLASISLPAATGIGDRAFSDCTSLASISLPAATGIGNWAFSGCTSLASYIFGETPPATSGTNIVKDANANPTYYHRGGTGWAAFNLGHDGTKITLKNIAGLAYSLEAINPQAVHLPLAGTQSFATSIIKPVGDASVDKLNLSVNDNFVTWQLLPEDGTGLIPVRSYISANGEVVIDELEKNPSLTVKANINVGGENNSQTAIITLAEGLYACEVQSMQTPVGAAINGTNITLSLPHTAKGQSQPVAITVSQYTTWQLYSDAACSIALANNTMPALQTGINTAYIKVTAPDKIAKIYTLSITVAADPPAPAPDDPAPPTQTPAPEDPAPPTPTPTPAPAPAAKAPAVTKVKMGQAKVTLVAKKSYTPAVSVYASDKSNDKLTWKSSNIKIAKVTASGKITAVKKGKAKITATASNGKSASIAVTVISKANKSLKVKTVSAAIPKNLKVGKSKDVTAKYAPANVPSVKTTYKSSNKKIAIIDKSGRLIAKKAGKVKITIKAGGVSKVYALTIKK